MGVIFNVCDAEEVTVGTSTKESHIKSSEENTTNIDLLIRQTQLLKNVVHLFTLLQHVSAVILDHHQAERPQLVVEK